MIAYDPIVPIIDSYVAIYKIYVLKDPFSDEVFYVGQTQKSLDERLSQHISCTEYNKEKCEYIQGIISRGGKPIIESIEVISGLCYVDKLSVNEREIYWIKFYTQSGCKLLNVNSIDPKSKCIEYHQYLTAIKGRKTDLKYYYCGKTVTGVTVYDKRRLELDGFVLNETKNEPPKDEKFDGNVSFNPFINERFRRKNELREFNFSKSDDFYYDDESPDYIRCSIED